MQLSRALPALMAALLVVLAACTASVPGGSPVPSSSGGGGGPVSRTSDGGQVTVVVSWAGPDAGAVFDVKLDTHSVDLDALDLADATLTNDRGETLAAEAWTAPKGGHHRAGSLAFEGDAAAFLAGAAWIEMTIPGVGDVPERTLRWEVAT